MSLLARLAADHPKTPAPVRLKAALLFAGVRYHPCLAEAADWAFPAYWPHQIPPGEPSFRGKRVTDVPYLVVFDDESQVRLRIKPDSPFIIRPEGEGYALFDGEARLTGLTFERKHPWTNALTADGTPMKSTGLSQHGDMLVLNAAPGCEYFVVPGEEGRSKNLSCTFCLYGVPDQRMKSLGQELFKVELPDSTLNHVVEAASHPETHARHLYLVGGSMLDMAQEGARYVQLARRLAEAGLMDRYYVACGSGALLKPHMEQLKALGVKGACFNLEVWDPAQFKRICPGKDHVVGRDRWLRALEEAVEVFGRGHVSTAFVGGVELEGEGAFESVEAALQSNLEGARWLIERDIQAIWSLHWKVTGKNRGDEPVYSLDHFLKLNEGLSELRHAANLPINTDFFCHHCAYMQLEPDFDRFIPFKPE
ncbi:hypothetical protein KKF91_06775 [Myxococcota bacterium]|nr:hypothetical protein [Myxococcota bacterium]MBU1430259.1 hypothetical protein [Myxococcota bacterium]MBU1897186.1 hypothetical protein [Myxococcota bacterium]